MKNKQISSYCVTLYCLRQFFSPSQLLTTYKDLDRPSMEYASHSALLDRLVKGFSSPPPSPSPVPSPLPPPSLPGSINRCSWYQISRWYFVNVALSDPSSWKKEGREGVTGGKEEETEGREGGGGEGREGKGSKEMK